MASLGELIQLAQFQMQNKQMNNPLANMTELGVSVGKGLENFQAKKTKNRLMDMINKGGDTAGMSWEIDDDGKVKFKKDNSGIKDKVYSVGNKIVKYDAAKNAADVVYSDEDSTKKVESDIKSSVAAGTPLTKNQKDYYNKFMAPTAVRTPFEDDEEIPANPETPAKPKYDPTAVSGWQDVPFISRLISALTPSATPEEKKLGGLKPGGVFNAPKVKAAPTGTEKPVVDKKDVTIELDPNIKTTSEAVSYLMKNYKMSKDEAVNWIRTQ